MPPLGRIDLAEITSLISQEKFFVLSAKTNRQNYLPFGPDGLSECWWQLKVSVLQRGGGPGCQGECLARYERDFEIVREMTQGQPWLVNALGYEPCFNQFYIHIKSWLKEQGVTAILIMGE